MPPPLSVQGTKKKPALDMSDDEQELKDRPAFQPIMVKDKQVLFFSRLCLCCLCRASAQDAQMEARVLVWVSVRGHRVQSRRSP